MGKSVGQSARAIVSMNNEMPARPPRLDQLTSLRFVAAIVVVLSHATRDLAYIPSVSELATLGTAGVGFFFALSGFVLTWAHRDNDTPGRFYRRRFARVYPLHFLMFLVAIPVVLIFLDGITIPEAIANVLLLQAWVPSEAVHFGMNAPSWSLACELLFYALFPFLIRPLSRLTQRQTVVTLGAVLVVVLIVAVGVTLLLGRGPVSTFALYVFPPARVLGFVAGCLAAHAIKSGVRLRVPLWLALTALGAAYVVVTGIQTVVGIGPGIQDALILPFIVIVLFAAADAGLGGTNGVLTRPSFIRLGEWSFALYLSHWLLVQTWSGLDPSANDRDVAWRILEVAVFLVVAVAISAVLYLFVEKPLESRLRGARPRPEAVLHAR